jgi:hypothetical protein
MAEALEWLLLLDAKHMKLNAQQYKHAVASSPLTAFCINK